MNVIDKVFGLSPQALTIRSARFEQIAANLANADTPGYKAMDIDFAAAISQARGDQDLTPSGRSSGSAAQPYLGQPELLYRQPSQTSLDGNTVETDQEHAAFMDNAIRYQASLNFLDGRIKSLLLALRGE